MITLLTIIAYLAVMYLLLKVMLWVTKIWLKISIGVLEVALVISALSILF